MVSFIVPIYNAERYLRKCVESILKQKNVDPMSLQVILVDDGSTDHSLDLARALAGVDGRVEVYAQAHAGQSAARNRGMEHVRGEFIAFVDADDWIEPDWLITHMKAIVNKDYVQSGAPRHRFQYTVVWQRLYRRNAIVHLRFPEGMIYEDAVWSVDLWLSGATCRVIQYNGYHYTQNPESTTSKAHPEAQKRVVEELKKRLVGAKFIDRCIIRYTILRIQMHFMKQ